MGTCCSFCSFIFSFQHTSSISPFWSSVEFSLALNKDILETKLSCVESESFGDLPESEDRKVNPSHGTRDACGSCTIALRTSRHWRSQSSSVVPPKVEQTFTIGVITLGVKSVKVSPAIKLVNLEFRKETRISLEVDSSAALSSLTFVTPQ